MTTGPGGGGGTGPGGGSGTGPGRDELVALDSIALLLRTCQLVAERKLAGADPALVHALAERLRLTRRAVADLQDSGRDGKAAAAVSRPVQATRLLLGERLAPGSGTAFSGAVTESGGAVVAPIAGALLPAGRPPLPGGGFTLPRPPDFEIGLAKTH